MRAQHLYIDLLQDNPYQPRTSKDEEKLEQLAISIMENGLLHPPLVHEYENGCYTIVAGHRRVQACRKLGMKTMPVWLIQLSDPTHLAKASLVENLQRHDLNPMEIARSLQRLQQDFGFSHEQIADALGKKRSSVSNFLRLLQLSPSLQQCVEAQQISFGHAKILASLCCEEQEKWLGIILKRSLSVHALEKALEVIPKLKTKPLLASEASEQIEQALIKRFGLHAKVHIDKAGKGWVKLHFTNVKDLSDLTGQWDF